MARWIKTYGETTAHAIAAANGHEPALDLTVKERSGSYGPRGSAAACCRPASVRTIAHGPVTALPGFAEGAWWVQDAAAALPARLFGDRRRAARRRSLRRARRQDRAACRRRRSRHRGRSRAGAARPAARQSAPAVACSRARLRRCRRSGRPSNVRRRSARRAVLLDRHHPPPSRRAVAQARRRHRRARRAAAPVDRARASALTKTGRHARSIAPARSSPRRTRTSSPTLLARDAGVRRAPIAAARGFRPRRVHHRGRRPAHAALPAARCRFAACRARRLLCRAAGKTIAITQ